MITRRNVVLNTLTLHNVFGVLECCLVHFLADSIAQSVTVSMEEVEVLLDLSWEWWLRMLPGSSFKEVVDWLAELLKLSF